MKHGKWLDVNDVINGLVKVLRRSLLEHANMEGRLVSVRSLADAFKGIGVTLRLSSLHLVT